MARIQFINCANEGSLTDHDVEAGTTVGQFLDGELENQEVLETFIVRVNRGEVEPNNYVLKDGDRVTLSPNNIAGE